MMLPRNPLLLVTALILFILSWAIVHSAHAGPRMKWVPAGNPGLESHKCYDARFFFYTLIKKVGKKTYELRSNNMPPGYQQAIYETKIRIRGPGPVGGHLRLVRHEEFTLESGFTVDLPVMQDCQPDVE
jgi:hypothetical protein